MIAITCRDLCTHLSIECPEENMFPCSESPPDNPVCVSELQFCDGIADCPGGSDEPADCARGQATCEVKLVLTISNMPVFRVLCARRGTISE